VSYEIPLGISIIVGIMAAGTLNMVALSHLQGGGLHTWLIYRNPFTFLAFGVFFVASLASNKRAPFDLPESESELVAGFHTEYSGLRFSFFFFAEYAAMFVIAGIQVGLFLGGWHDPLGLMGYLDARYRPAWQADPTLANALPLLLLNVMGVGMFVGKCVALVFVQMWLRWTLPRPRIDQVLYACVKVLLPMSCVLLLGAALWQLLVEEIPTVPWTTFPAYSTYSQVAGEVFNPWNFGQWARAGATGALVTQIVLTLIGVTGFVAVVGWVGYAFVTGRNLKQRLTDPAPIVKDAELEPAT